MLELGCLVQRDHDELHYVLRVLNESSDEAQLFDKLERARTIFLAHAGAETMALGTMLEHNRPPPSLYLLVSQVVASHLTQESVLDELYNLRLGTPTFRECARYLRQLMTHHADHEAACLHPALPDCLPREVVRTLATSYAIERDGILDDHRKLACLEPAIVRYA